MALVRRAPSAQITIARLDGIVRPDLLPAYGRRAITAEIDGMLAATAEALPGKDVEKLLKGEWGRPPGKVLDELDLDTPLAVRPHAQAHRGALDGEPVVVKVARPRLAAAVRNDLTLLDALARPLSAAFPALDTATMLAEVRERVLDELDLEHEASVHRQVQRGLRRVEGVEVARVHTELTTHAVAVSAFLEGPTLASGARPDDPRAVARTLLTVYLGAPRALGLVLANPRASDVVLSPGGGIGLIGPGTARAAEPARLDASIAALEALRDGDDAGFADAVGRLGLLPADAVAGLRPHVDAILGPLLLSGPARVDDDALAAAGERALDRLAGLMELAARGTPDPADLWPGRMLGQLASLLALLEIEEDWLALAIEALERGWTPAGAQQ
jgi:predicted unusual protein kinase regulating ubiquinone biosynthesis (AarF/ABC1/UbiB family)